VLEQLLRNDGLSYTNILPQVRGKSKLSIVTSLLRRSWAMLPILLKTKPDLLVGTDATIAQLGRLLNIDRITTTEDDYEVIKSLGDLAYPFTQTILCPQVCSVGKWDRKKVGYPGYMKLGYLHPNVFRVEEEVPERYGLPERFLLVRLAQLSAHHDFGIKGISPALLDKIISVAEARQYKVYISSEGKLDDAYLPYQLSINPNDMHQVLAHASALVCDSQSMTMEAAMLGTPSLRYSDFAGRISVLEELENEYRLTQGIPTGNDTRLLARLEELLNTPDLRKEYQTRRNKMLADKIDVTAFLVWFLENYPSSKTTLLKQPSYYSRFK